MRKLFGLLIALLVVPALTQAQAQYGPGSVTINQNATSSSLITPTNGGFASTLANLFGFRVVTVSGAITAATTDHVIEVNKTTGAPTTVNMPSCSTNAGLQLVIVDGKGDAGTNNITLTPSAGNINGSTTLIMSINRQSESVVYDGTQCVAFP